MVIRIGPLLAAVCLVAVKSAALGFSLPEAGYSGRIAENLPAGSVVRLNPELKITQGDELVCQFNIVKHHGETRAPFQLNVLDQGTGLAQLTTSESLDFEQRSEYTFQVEAISCAGTYSDRVHVTVDVDDVNEFAPEWPSESIKAVLKEGEVVEDLVTLSATDRDGTGRVCRYTIETENQPFEISDATGVLKPVRPLNYSESHSYVLSVVAEDCQGLKSAPMLIVVEVQRPCNTGWTDLTSFLNYIPSTGPQPIFPKATFMTCPGEDNDCKVESVKATVKLETAHIGKGCDRDTYSLWSQRRLCGANQQAVELLPPDKNIAEQRDQGHLSDATITRFDGKTGVDVADFAPGDKFTFSTWLKHTESNEEDKHRKEHIICRADDHKKNRHHMALFIRNCKLVLLLRREYSVGEENVFRPAEWRWKLPQVCDNEWHHIALLVTFPMVDLVIDGDRWQPTKDNPEVIDDWPLHPVADVNTKTTLGACWQGSEDTYKHQLSGYLAGVSYLSDATENLEVIRCLHQCAESLQIPAASAIAPGMEMVANGKGSAVTVDGPSGEGLDRLLQQVAYLNTREFPSPGRRLVTLSTWVTCAGNDQEVTLQEHKATVNVLSVQEPKIAISGTKDIAREHQDFKMGVRIFADVHILMTTGSPENGEPVNGIENRLDSCTVTVSPPLNADHEIIDIPEALLQSLNIVGKVTSQGATFQGAEMIYNYERLLRQVIYTNQKPAYYLNRQFGIVCSELSGRFVSNEYAQTLSVIHSADDEHVDDVHMKIQEQTAEETGYKTMKIDVATGARNNVVALMAVVFVFLLAVLMVLAIVRMRASHQRQQATAAAEEEMAWDDSALNITVNPLEDTTVANENPVEEYEEDEEDSFDSGSDEEDEDDDDEEEVRVVDQRRERLEWDNDL